MQKFKWSYHKVETLCNESSTSKKLNKRMLSETERIDFENKADTAADVAGVKSPIRQFIGNARNKP